jgi:predicted ferric reductase
MAFVTAEQGGAAQPPRAAVAPHAIAAPPARWPLLLLVYVVFAAAPVVIAWLQGYPRRPWNDEVSSAAAMVAFAMLLMEFVTTGRIPFITNRLHQGLTLRWHRTAGIVIAAIALLHPFFYSDPATYPPVDDPTNLVHLGLTPLSLASGLAALVLLMALVLLAVFRDQLPYRYETWRISHALGLATVAALVLVHALVAGRYSNIDAIHWLWIGLATAAALALVYSFVIVPLRMRKHPYRVSVLRKTKPGEWLIVLEPQGFTVPPLRPGQFFWMSLNSPFSRLEHPFTVIPQPEPGKLSFHIHEHGDWTGQAGFIPLGATAYINGPYG